MAQPMDFTDDEFDLLIRLPRVLGGAGGGDNDTAQLTPLSRALHEVERVHGKSGLLEVISTEALESTEVATDATGDAWLAVVMENARSVAALLDRKATETDTAVYKQWCLEIISVLGEVNGQGLLAGRQVSLDIAAFSTQLTEALDASSPL